MTSKIEILKASQNVIDGTSTHHMRIGASAQTRLRKQRVAANPTHRQGRKMREECNDR